MTTSTAPSVRRRSPSGLPIIGALVVVVAFFLGTGAIAYLNTLTLRRSARQVSYSHEVIGALEDVLALLKDAETGQRGFVITGDDKYLEPYNSALPRIDARVVEVSRLTSDNADLHLARVGPAAVQFDDRLRNCQAETKAAIAMLSGHIALFECSSKTR